MKIWLINPPTSEKMFKEGRCQQKTEFYQTNYPPLTLVYLASILRKKFDVRIIDGTTGRHTQEAVIEEYKKEKPGIVFVNSTTPTIELDIEFIKSLLSIRKCEIKLFGIHVSFWKKEYEDKNIEVMKDPQRVAYKLIGETTPENLDGLAFPSWDLVDLSTYKLPLIGEKFVLLQASKGCPHECIFCTNPYYSNRKVKQRSVDSVISELKYIKSLGINQVIFFTDTFTLNKEWVIKFCNKVIDEKINMGFSCNSRVDTVDEEMLQIMKKAGFWLMSFGIESGNQKILDNAKKKITLEQAEKTIKAAYENSILTLGHFIMGLPGETKETALQTIKFSKKLPLDFAMFYIATPFPGSELYEIEKKKGNIKSKNWMDFEYSKQSISTNLDLEALRKKAYLYFYFNKTIRRLFRIKKITGKGFISLFSAGINFMKLYFRS